ncbi:TlpA family protein disulfide reductase [Nonomuraea diastatica]|uniref:Redoxin domain-containing protein n=1 Tax=Nonomuraea diastatica TaxID=1848329 RepID=A0A4R4VXR9_9ACTN|nr:hypothetical protein E1294_49630 [Nonomuraea diastatica]
MATDGEPISAAYLEGRALIGFFSPGCQPCRELLPKFVKQAEQASGPVVAVVVAAPQDDPAMDIARLEKVARVVSEAPQGPVQQVFKVSGYPTDATGTVVFSDAALPHQVHMIGTARAAADVALRTAPGMMAVFVLVT